MSPFAKYFLVGMVSVLAGSAGGLLASFDRWTAEGVAAAAAWATVVVAAVAAALALGQVREAQRLRLEQAKPYVVAFMEPEDSNPMIVNLVVQNFGATAAYDVRIRATPTLQRSSHAGGPVEEVWLPDTIPTLVPGQRWQTLWDISYERPESSPPVAARHEASISYVDPNRGPGSPREVTTAVLDWAHFSGRRWVQTYGLHHAATALREIEKRLRQHSTPSQGANVWVRDADEFIAARRRQFDEWMAAAKAHDESTAGLDDAGEGAADAPRPRSE